MRLLATIKLRQFIYGILAFIVAAAVSVWMTVRAGADAVQSLSDGQLLTRLVGLPAAFATLTFGVAMAIAARRPAGAVDEFEKRNRRFAD